MANKLRRHKSFSCPHLLISDLSVPSQESKLEIKIENHTQTNFRHQNTKYSEVKCEESDTVGITEDFNNLNFLRPNLEISRRLSESLPKDIERLSSAGRKLGTVAKPYHMECFEQSENEISPMIEKYR